MKASPLLRAWIRSLEAAGVGVPHPLALAGLARRRRALRHAGRPAGDRGARHRAGARRRLLGAARLRRRLGRGPRRRTGVALAPFRPSNVGFRVAWSPAMARHFGAPVKPVRLTAAGRSVVAEFVVSARGVEGGGIYALADLLRDGAPLTLDLLPGRAEAELAARLARPRGGASLANHLRKTLGLRRSRSRCCASARRPRSATRGHRPRAQGAAAAARRPAPDRRGDLDRRRRHAGGADAA